MTEKKVALVGCHCYDRDLVEGKVAMALDLLGGPRELFGTGKTVFLKVNALVAVDPGEGTTTNPEVVRALVVNLRPVAGRIIIGDSPGGVFNHAFLNRVYGKTGLAAVADETGAELNFDTSVQHVAVPEGARAKSVPLCGAMRNADVLISVPKYKTHGLVNITGAVKNLYGAVPGLNKFSYHARFSDPEEFADLLVDILLASSPDFHLIDAIDVMDGEGPRKGEIKRAGVLAAGRDPFELDAAMMRLIGHEPVDNLALASAARRGLWSDEAGAVEPVGDRPSSLCVEGFRLPGQRRSGGRLPPFVMNFLKKKFADALQMRPVPVPGLCTGCGTCAQICPVGAIDVRGTARIDAGRCIRCYCCHEVCEPGAIELKKPAILRTAARIGG